MYRKRQAAGGGITSENILLCTSDKTPAGGFAEVFASPAMTGGKLCYCYIHRILIAMLTSDIGWK